MTSYQMEAVLPIDSSQETFSQASLPNESTLTLQIQDFTKDFSLGSAKTTPKSTDQISPSFKKSESTSKLARWKAGKSVSLTSAGLSELQENCLESITTRSEDLTGKLESPKLSAKMQMVFTSNVNLSENIIKNTVQAVDDSCIKVENKDLQVELEISGLKLQHLEKKLEGCLASSKSTLALNAELSENVSRMVSPQKSPHELKAKTTTSQANTQRDDETLSPKTLQKGLSKLLNEEIENMERLENVYQNRSRSSQKRQDTVSSISSSGAKDRDLRFKQFPFDNQENTQSVLSKGLKMLEKYRDVSPLGERSPNANHETNSQRRESNQKLRSYFEAHSGTNKSESKDAENGSIAESSKSKKPGKLTKAVECTFNNITFQNSVIEKDTQLGSDSKRKDDAKNTERNCSIEDSSRTFDSKINIIITSRTPSINMASVLDGEAKRDNFRREIIFIDDGGKEKVYVIKPKEKLTIQKLETVCVDFSKEEKIFFSTQELKKEPSVNSQSELGQLDSIQLRAIEECCSTNENSARANPKLQEMNSERINIYDSPYIVSLNLDKQDKDKNERISAFGQKARFFDQDQQKAAVYKMEDLSFNNLKLHAINNSDSAFREEQSLHSGFAAISNRWESNPKETDRPESYLKQKISDFRNFLNEFEEAIASEPLLSPLIKPGSHENMLKPHRNPNNTQARNSMEVKNIDLKFEKQDFCEQELDETPKVQFTGRTEEGMTTIRKDSKQKLQHQLSDKSPKAIRAFSDKEFEVQKQRLQNSLASPLSSNKRFSLTKNNLNHSNSGMLKTKLTENDEEAAKVPAQNAKGHKFSRTLSTTAFLNSGSTDTTKDTFNRKTLSTSKLLKSTDKIKIDPTKVHPDTQILQNNNIKCRKPVQKSIGGGPRVEVVVLGKNTKRTNSMIEK